MFTDLGLTTACLLAPAFLAAFAAAVEGRRCERCGKDGPGVMWDKLMKTYLCHFCWVSTPIPKPGPRR